MKIGVPEISFQNSDFVALFCTCRSIEAVSLPIIRSDGKREGRHGPFNIRSG